MTNHETFNAGNVVLQSGRTFPDMHLASSPLIPTSLHPASAVSNTTLELAALPEPACLLAEKGLLAEAPLSDFATVSTEQVVTIQCQQIGVLYGIY